MKGFKFIASVFTLIMIVVGFISCMEVKAGETQKVPTPMVLKTSIGLHGNIKAKDLGEVISYDADPETGCIKKLRPVTEVDCKR